MKDTATRKTAKPKKSSVAVPSGETGKPAATRAPGSIEVYRADFDRQAAGPDWLNALRREGIARFESLGFPNTKNEDWHFTSVATIAERSFHIAKDDARAESRENAAGMIGRGDFDRFSFGEREWHTFVFINGRFSEDLSSYAGLGAGVRVSSLATAIRSGIGRPERHLGRIAAFGQHAFTALNTAFISDGAFIELQANAVVKHPIHLLFISVGDAEAVSHPRNLIVAAPNSRASIVESYVSVGESTYFTNAVTEISLGEGARLDYYKIQRESEKAFHVGTAQVRQERDSQLHSFSFAVGGSLARTNVYTSLDGDGATCTLNGLYLADGNQHIDNQTSIEHIAPNCPSHEVYKGVLDGRSHGVFNGKVYVHPEAQKTDGKQSNNNLLLSPNARVDTKPQLEIFADDVKCTHGATVGRLDDVAMFYLNSRGIGPETARMLLTYAFAADVLETIELEPLKKELEKMVLARFATTSISA
ncbi:MAG TPA: Fe-S cluster assembly protein SufD [Gemmatimonadaceae bacterium]|nr:Fe-S cluster assembly protein SufD [Gemmatimonadaceae bacterium]